MIINIDFKINFNKINSDVKIININNNINITLKSVRVWRTSEKIYTAPYILKLLWLVILPSNIFYYVNCMNLDK